MSKYNQGSLSRHPLSSAFPDMGREEYLELVEDIRKNGLLTPVVLFDGAILDGWHRYQAALDAEAKINFTHFAGDDPVAYVLSLNMHRRHLTGSQRAAAVVACSQWAKSGDNQHTAGGEPGSPPQTNQSMAKTADVSEKTIKQAKRAQEAGLGDKVRDGELTAKQAAQIAKLPEDERQAAIEAPKKPSQPPPQEKLEVGKADEVEKLKGRVVELETALKQRDEEMSELASLMEHTMAENDALRRTIDAEDLLGQFDKEIHQVRELARVTQARNRALTEEVNQLKGFAKMWRGKFERLEKQMREAAA